MCITLNFFSLFMLRVCVSLCKKVGGGEMSEIEKLRKWAIKIFESKNVNEAVELLDEAIEKRIIKDYFISDDWDLFVLTQEGRAFIITAGYNKTYDTLILDIIEIPTEDYFEIRKDYVFD